MTNFVLYVYVSNAPVLHQVMRVEESHPSGSAQKGHSTNVFWGVCNSSCLILLAGLRAEWLQCLEGAVSGLINC